MGGTSHELHESFDLRWNAISERVSCRTVDVKVSSIPDHRGGSNALGDRVPPNKEIVKKDAFE